MSRRLCIMHVLRLGGHVDEPLLRTMPSVTPEHFRHMWGPKLRKVTYRDYTLVMGTVVLVAVLVIVFNLIADLIAAALDPRVRLSA